MLHTVKLPVGPRPGWELEEEEEDGTELHSVSESLIILQSLRQSRNKWLSSTFPKFSAKARGGKPPDVVPPPHTIKAYGKFDLHVGPHVFANTAIYEVHYLPHVDPSQTVPQQQGVSSQRSMTGSWVYEVTKAQSPSTHTYPSGQAASAQPASPFTSLASDSFVTPALITQVNAAALSNPILANLLSLAASGRATADQLKTLGLLIQSLGSVRQPLYESGPSTLPASPMVVPPPPPPAPPKEFDIVIEFHERPTDRWVIPGQMSSVNAWIILKAIWGLFTVWCGGEKKIEESRQRLLTIAQKAPKRSFLRYQLSDGPLLTELQNAVAPPYATKSIKPINADGGRTKRRSAPRKPAVDASSNVPGKTPPAKRRQLAAKPKIPTAPQLRVMRVGRKMFR
ncbi:hypothetical protein A0H81_11450 [Grifola frondosa]|uniref:Uncharacterized protein n=1 Tax=Grifola frondosa TaxID=5627 RepID=A0A1C7LWL4_GRIFR|nr:hypothetical protein A0H81_11450 [Grifola frondosa]